MLIGLFVSKIFKLLSRPSRCVEKRLDKKLKVNFKISDVTDWKTNNYNTYIVHISRSKSNKTMKFGQLIEYSIKILFLKNHTQNVVEKLVPDPFMKNRNLA